MADPLPSVVVQQSPIEGTGVFSVGRIQAGTPVLEYVGERIDKAESLRRCEANNPYIFSLNEETDLDGSGPENIARFVNHSCSPNCDAEFIDDRVWLISRREIAPSEELTFNYGYDLVDFRDHPCHCKADNCVGYIVAEELWSSLPINRSAIIHDR